VSGATDATTDGTGADGKTDASTASSAGGAVAHSAADDAAGTRKDSRVPAAAGGSRQGETRSAERAQAGGTTVTETRGPRPPQPHHPPQAYQPPQSADQGVVRQPRPAAARPLPRTRRARLRVAKADPWSVMKVSFLFSIALGICTIVAVSVLWLVLDGLGVFSTVGGTISEATGSGQQSGFDLQSFLSLSNVVLFTTVIAVIDVVLATALATLGAFIYNLSAGFVGGVELTLAEDE
jgi:hypothetical protein